jgi:asparagine synthetase B (glutamine-hydrolysing)
MILRDFVLCFSKDDLGFKELYIDERNMKQIGYDTLIIYSTYDFLFSNSCSGIKSLNKELNLKYKLQDMWEFDEYFLGKSIVCKTDGIDKLLSAELLIL